MIVDTHAHLTFEGLREDVEGVLERARAAGVTTVVTVGTDPEDSRSAVALAQRFANVWATVGVHPHDAAGMTDARLDELAELARNPKVVAWGEAGLDYFRDRSPRDVQRKWFARQAALARELELPLVVHDREAHEDVMRVIEPEARRGLRGVMHCFSGDAELARRVVALGWFVSVPGTVTYKKNATLHEVVRQTPLERCVVETDCPYLTPEPFRGKKNEPALIRHTVEAVAGLKGLSFEDAARITSRAAVELFGVGETQTPQIAYAIRRSLYLNLTDRCTNRCAFCPKNRTTVVKGHDLALSGEPTAAELLRAVEAQGGPGAWEEVVFCGYGEPLTRPDTVIEVARELKRRGAKKIRVNTDGLGSLASGRDLAAELSGLVDAVSVSLNAPDAATYEKLCRPTLPGAYDAVLGFLEGAKGRIPEVTATAVALPGLDVAACEAVARRLGVGFRVRPYNELG